MSFNVIQILNWPSIVKFCFFQMIHNITFLNYARGLPYHPTKGLGRSAHYTKLFYQLQLNHAMLGGVSMGGDNDGIVHVNSAYHDKACPAREGGPNTKSEEIKGIQFRKCMS